jgi:hypothetical protein
MSPPPALLLGGTKMEAARLQRVLAEIADLQLVGVLACARAQQTVSNFCLICVWRRERPARLIPKDLMRRVFRAV